MTEATRFSVWKELAATARSELALRLLLLGVLLQPVGQRWVRPVVLVVATLGLLSPRALASPWLWTVLTVLTTIRIASGWPTNDNHAYLLVYWCLAATLATASGRRDEILAWNGRMLVGLTFLFATLWKLVLSPDFADGTFFRVSLVDEPRFEAFTRLTVGIGRDEVLDLRDLVRDHSDGVFVPWPEMPVPPPRLFAVASVLTVATLAFEGAMALAFLAPSGWRVARVRHALLALFCATTYMLAPVAGFGWILVSMGVASCEPERRRARFAYLIAFLVVLLATRWPWQRLVLDG
jgi:hypothetical protein